MINVPHDDDLAIGTWRFVRCDGRRVVKLRCPECGAAGGLGDHAVDDFGRVRPSVRCTAGNCGFHAMILLEDWTYRRMREGD